MNKTSTLLTTFLLITFACSNAQSIESLRQKINQVLEGKSATVGVSVNGMNTNDTLSINGNMHLPMQSVFKFHLAIAVLHQIDLGKFRLDKKISIDKKLVQKYKHLWSPLKEDHPNGAELTVAEILKYTVSLSDNLGCDILFELVGGTKVVESYIHDIGIKDIAIVHNEFVMQADWQKQYENWTTAKASNLVLKVFYENAKNLLSKNSYNFLLDILKGTKTGKKSIKGLLSKDTIVAHKTGYSGKDKKGMIGALNDIGIVFLSEDQHFYLSVLVSDSMESYEISQKIIAEIAKLTWEYFNK